MMDAGFDREVCVGLYEVIKTMEAEYIPEIIVEPPYEEPPYISKLHPYKKHESHKRPIYWHRIRSRPG